MPTIVAALVILTALTLLNLLLTFGVIRRLREYAPLLDQSGPPVTLAVGTQVPDFTAQSADGAVVTAATLRGAGGLVMFLAPDCSGCQEQLPAVREKLTEAAASPLTILVVLTRLRPSSEPDDADAAELEEALRVVDQRAMIVHEPLDGPVQSTFQVAAFPAFYVVDDAGRVASAGNGAADLPRLSGVGDVVAAGR